MMKYEICNVIQILKYNILKFILLPSNAYPSIMINMHNLLKYFQDAKNSGLKSVNIFHSVSSYFVQIFSCKFHSGPRQ